MREDVNERACDLAVYLLETRGTVRSAAAHFGISKSTAHQDLTRRLCKCRPALYREVAALLAENKAERHLRGGAATRRKYRESAASENASHNPPRR